MNRLESELFDLEERLMRNDGMADDSTYSTIVGIANEVSELEAENAKLKELFYEAWEWMQRARYDESIRNDEMDGIGSKAIRLGFPDYELGIEVDE